MKIYRSIDEIQPISNAVVTTGSFDGVHIGHKTILQRIHTLAKQINGESVLITFYPHPRKVLFPDKQGKDLQMINSQEEKIMLLEKAGLDNLVIIPFTLEFSRISSEKFITEILLHKIGAKVIVVGFNHHFGHNREGDFQYLYNLRTTYHFEVEEIPEQDIQNETVSSTLIRKALREGKIQRANAYLDHQYILRGKVFPGHQTFELAGFPMKKIRIQEECKLIPPSGIYACSLNEEGTYTKVLAIIENSSVPCLKDSREILVHFYELNGAKVQADEKITLYFHKRMADLPEEPERNHLKRHIESELRNIEELIY